MSVFEVGLERSIDRSRVGDASGVGADAVAKGSISPRILRVSHEIGLRYFEEV